MVRRVIDFDVYTTSPHSYYNQIMCTSVDTIRVEFDWDEKEDIMKSATRALREKHQDKDFEIQYWWWIQ